MKNKRTILYILIIYLLLSMLVYFTGGFIVVNAEQVRYSDTSTTITEYYMDGSDAETITYTIDPFFKNSINFYPINLNSLSSKFTSLRIQPSINLDTYVESNTPIYAKVLLHAKYYYDIKEEGNFSLLTSLIEEEHFFSHGFEGSNYEVEDFLTKIYIDDNGIYSYDEFILLSAKLEGSSLLSTLKTTNFQFVIYSLSYNHISTTIPKTNIPSYIEIYDYIYSDEEITLTIEDDLSSYDDKLYFDPDDIEFPSDQNLAEDDSLLGWIKRIFNTLLDSFKRILLFPVTIFNTIIDVFSKLFIPSVDSIKEHFQANYTLFENQLGFLFTPFEILESVLGYYNNLGEGSGIISIPTIKDPFYNQTIIQARSFNLKETFQTGALGNAHNIYLICVDAIIVIALLNLCVKKFNSVFKDGGNS